jgi:hypothetical protein
MMGARRYRWFLSWCAQSRAWQHAFDALLQTADIAELRVAVWSNKGSAEDCTRALHSLLRARYVDNHATVSPSFFRS